MRPSPSLASTAEAAVVAAASASSAESPASWRSATYSFEYFALQASDSLYLSRFTNPLAEVTNFRYDGLRRLFTFELAAVSETTTFLWDGRRVSRITRPDGVETSFQITGDDVTQVSEATGNVTTIGYAPDAIDPGNPRGRPVDAISDSLGLVLDRAYDPQGRLTSVTNGAGETPRPTRGSRGARPSWPRSARRRAPSPPSATTARTGTRGGP